MPKATNQQPEPVSNAEQEGFVELIFKPGRNPLGLSKEGPYWITCQQLDQMIENGGHIEIDDLVAGLIEWLKVTDEPDPALISLQRLFTARAGERAGRASAKPS